MTKLFFVSILARQMNNFTVNVTTAVGCVMALATRCQLICLVSITAPKQKDEVLVSALLPKEGPS